MKKNKQPLKRNMDCKMEQKKQLLMNTLMEDGTTAWDYVLTKRTESQPWIAAGILSCMKKGYNLNPMVVNWEARELRYSK